MREKLVKESCMKYTCVIGYIFVAASQPWIWYDVRICDDSGTTCMESW
jgi:hypothetical protein